MVDTAPGDPPTATVAFRPARVNRLLGTDLPANEQQGLLARVGIATGAASTETIVPVAGAPAR
ncbi:MAG: hypothetical protein WKF78_14630 [Candidatus Limnocylindrales bacterium]